MPAFPMGSGSASALVALAVVAGCIPGPATPSPSPVTPTASPAPAAIAPSPIVIGAGSLVVVGRIVTMDDPPEAEAVLVKDGLVAVIGTRDQVMALAGDEVPVIDIGDDVAYPGFIDAHAHWIGDREHYPASTRRPRPDAAMARGWTSISEQWVSPERLDELDAPRSGRRPADACRRLPGLELRHSTSRGLVRAAQARHRGRPSPRSGVEDPPRRWPGRRAQLGAASDLTAGDRPGETKPAGRSRSTP